jgi:hypothetical protein
MTRFICIVLILCLSCNNKSKQNRDDNSKSDSLKVVSLRKKIDPLLFNSDSKAIAHTLDSIKHLATEAHPHLLFYWLETKNQQMALEGNVDSSIYYLSQAQQVATENDFNYKELLVTKTGLTRNLIAQNKMDSALRCAQEGYFLARKNNEVHLPINYHLFEIYSAIGDRENAKKYLFEGYQECGDDPYFKVFFSAGMAKYYEEKGQPDSALYYFRYLEKDTVFRSKQFFASRDENIGTLLTSNNQPEKGLAYLLRALPIERETGQINGLTMLNVALCYSKLKNYNTSLAYLDSTGYYGDTLKDLSLARQVWELRASNYASIGKSTKAYLAEKNAFNFYKQERDTLLAKNARELETRYRVREKEDKIESLAAVNKVQSEISRQRKIINVGMGIVLLLTIFIGLLLLRRRKLQLQIREAQLTQQLLRSQMEPHFIFNSLTVLKSFITSEEPERSNAFLDKFSSLLRINLENARENLVLLRKEVEALRNYLDLHGMSFENLFTYQIEVYPEYEEDNIFIPPMLLQPFVENAIFHGFAEPNVKGAITIKIERDRSILHCIIEDNGAGLNNVAMTNGKRSLSTLITQERLALLTKHTGKPAKLVITDKQLVNEGKGVRVALDIPIIKQNSSAIERLPLN